MEQSRHNKPMPRDDYVRTLLVDLIIILGAIVIVLACLLVIATRAHASPNCMSKAEARAAFPKSHLFWHSTRHCWDNNSAHRFHYRGPRIAPDILPVHAEIEPTGIDANGDELTPYDEVMEKPQPKDDACCWPPLDERSFKSRWDELPTQWMTKQ